MPGTNPFWAAWLPGRCWRYSSWWRWAYWAYSHGHRRSAPCGSAWRRTKTRRRAVGEILAPGSVGGVLFVSHQPFALGHQQTDVVGHDVERLPHLGIQRSLLPVSLLVCVVRGGDPSRPGFLAAEGDCGQVSVHF